MTYADLGRKTDDELDRLSRARAVLDGPNIFGDLGIQAHVPHADALTAVRDLIDAASAERERLIDEALAAGELSDREVARASGLSAPAIGRRRSQRES